MTTYLTDPPILADPVTGRRYPLQVSNLGALQVGPATSTPATTTRRLQLVDPSGIASYRVGLATGIPPAITATPIPTEFGFHQDLPLWSPNGREWTLQVQPDGSFTTTPLGSDWPMRPGPGRPTDTPTEALHYPPISFQDSSRRVWRMRVSDGGIWTLTPDVGTVLTLSAPALWTQDDQTPVQLDVTPNGILTVSTAPSSTPKVYETVLASPGGMLWTLIATTLTNGDVVLDISSVVQDAVDQRDEWPLVISQHGNYLYIADDRFPPPIPSMPRRWGQRRRMPRRQA